MFCGLINDWARGDYDSRYWQFSRNKTTSAGFYYPKYDRAYAYFTMIYYFVVYFDNTQGTRRTCGYIYNSIHMFIGYKYISSNLYGMLYAIVSHNFSYSAIGVGWDTRFLDLTYFGVLGTRRRCGYSLTLNAFIKRVYFFIAKNLMGVHRALHYITTRPEITMMNYITIFQLEFQTVHGIYSQYTHGTRQLAFYAQNYYVNCGISRGRSYMVQPSLFWCGSIILLHHIFNSNNSATIVIKLLSESIKDRDSIYTVSVGNKEYIYKFTLTSDTKCSGSFFIESDGWRSSVYSFSRPYNFIHINETSLDYHDACMFNQSYLMDVYISGGRKKAISTISVSNSGNKYTIKYTSIPVSLTQDIPLNAIKNLFAMSGAVNTVKQIISDVVYYNSKNLSLICYTDHPLQIVGVETGCSGWSRVSTLQCINSFFNQSFEFKESDGLYRVTESISGTIKRRYNMRIFDGKIIVPDRELVFSYQLDNGNVIFRKI